MKPVHACHADAVKLHWHSRRHQTTEEQVASREAYQATHGKGARQENAAERQAARDARSDFEQLKLIETRRGESKKEKARLMKKCLITTEGEK